MPASVSRMRALRRREERGRPWQTTPLTRSPGIGAHVLSSDLHVRGLERLDVCRSARTSTTHRAISDRLEPRRGPRSDGLALPGKAGASRASPAPVEAHAPWGKDLAAPEN